jgi:hypothetical protein
MSGMIRAANELWFFVCSLGGVTDVWRCRASGGNWLPGRFFLTPERRAVFTYRSVSQRGDSEAKSAIELEGFKLA